MPPVVCTSGSLDSTIIVLSSSGFISLSSSTSKIKFSISLVSFMEASKACIKAIIVSTLEITFSLLIALGVICAHELRTSCIFLILLRSLLFTKNLLVMTNQLRSKIRSNSAKSRPSMLVISLLSTCSRCNVLRLFTTSSCHQLSVIIGSFLLNHAPIFPLSRNMNSFILLIIYELFIVRPPNPFSIAYRNCSVPSQLHAKIH